MTSNFPLFEIIMQEIKSTVLNEYSFEEQEKLAEKIKLLDQQGHEIVLAIIRNYQLQIDHFEFHEVPYEAKTVKSGYRFFVNKLPTQLLYMINHFVNLHIEKQHEEKERNNFLLNK